MVKFRGEEVGGGVRHQKMEEEEEEEEECFVIPLCSSVAVEVDVVFVE